MDIKTKYNIGDTVYYFDMIKFKLRTVSILHIQITSDYYNTVIKYTIDLHKVCDTKCRIVNDLEAWIADNGNNIETLVIEEDKLFRSRGEFYSATVDKKEELLPKNNIFHAPDLTLDELERIITNGNT